MMSQTAMTSLLALYIQNIGGGPFWALVVEKMTLHIIFPNIIFLFIHASGPYYPKMARWELEVILSLVYKMILLILALELANMTK